MTGRVEITPLRGPLTLRWATEAHALSSTDARAVDDHWQSHRENHPSAFDGSIVCLERIEEDGLHVRTAPYRHWIAQRRAPSLFAAARLAPLAVTGILHVREGIVFGRRSTSVFQDAGCWELAPAGILDGAGGERAPEEQLAVEFTEELGASWSEVRSTRAALLARDPETDVVDIVFALDCPVPFAALEAAFEARASDEYAELRLVPRAEIPRFVEDTGDALASVSRAIVLSELSLSV